MSDELSPEELLARLERLEAAALGELYDRFAPRVLGVLMQTLVSREEAEEVLREVFLKLSRECRNLTQAGASVAAWLILKAREAAVDRMRGERPGKLRLAGPEEARGVDDRAAASPRSGSSLDSSPVARRQASGFPVAPNAARKPGVRGTARGVLRRELPPAWVPRPEAIRLIDERMDILHKVIHHLPSAQREALELAVFGGCGEREIAAQSGEPLGRARTGLRAAVTFVRHRRRAILGTWAANI